MARRLISAARLFRFVLASPIADLECVPPT
jgi:hypothetical protein